MRKLAITLSLLFTFGQVIMPSISASAVTFTSKNEVQTIVDSVGISNSDLDVEGNINEENNLEENTKDEVGNAVKDEVVESEENDFSIIDTESNSNTVDNTEDVKSDSLENNNEDNSKEDLEEVIFGDVYETTKLSENSRISNFSVQENDVHYSREEYAQDMNSLVDIEYLVNKTDSNFEVVLSIGDGVYKYVESVDTIEEAIELANSSETISSKASKARIVVESDAIPAVIDNNGVIVYATNAMGRILKHIGGEPYYGSDKLTYLYKDYSSTISSNYINQGYVDDTPIIEDRGNRAKIQVSGYTGWIDKDTSAAVYDLIVVPLNNAKNPSYYENINGDLYHWISTDITTAGRGNKRKIGLAPSFMKSGVKYYSYDGNYFYTDLNTLISDLKAGNNNNSVNSSEIFYSYYQILPFRSKTIYSASELNKFINDNTESNSKLRGTGQAFINAQNKYGVNAATMLGVAINESGWGMSNLALTKNNLFGLKAYDSNPNDAQGFASVEQCINEFAEYWISKGYADPQDDRYYGGFLGGKKLGANVRYASDPFWGEKAASYAYVIDRYLSGDGETLRDYNNNIIGIFVSPTKVLKSNGSQLYSITSTLEYNASYVGAPIVLKSTNRYNIAGKSCYAVNPDRTTELPLSGGAEFVGVYDWDMSGYIEDSSVSIINSRTSTTTNGISYKAHVRNIGWQGWVSNGETAGTIGKNLAMESLIINLEGMPSTANIKYRAHVQDIGWQDWVEAGEIAGTTGKVKNIEAIQIEASGLPDGKTVIYRTYVQDYGWQPWQSNGEISGTTGQNKKVEAVQIKVVSSTNISVGYKAYVDGYGWQNQVTDGQLAGTEGENRPMYGLQINMLTEIPGISIRYRTHVQDYGWQSWVSDGSISGSINPKKKIEAIQIEMSGAPEGYHIEYRTHVQDIGWQEWVRDGQVSGTEGKNKKIEAIEIRVVTSNNISVGYKAYVDGYGWQNQVTDGELAGTEGENRPMYALQINMLSDIPGVSVKYRTHVQDYGWQNWVSNGSVSGSINPKKKIEAIQIEMSGAPEGYHIEYRAHVQDIGWQNWVRDGQVAGTEGKNKKIEAIEIRVVKNDISDVVYVLDVLYKTHIQNDGWLQEVSNGILSGTEGKNRQVEALTIKLNSNIPGIGVKYRAHVQDIGWQDWVKDGQVAGTEGKNKQVEAIEIQLVGAPTGYHIEYRAHVQDIGWQDWVRDGQVAGTEGKNKQIEAIEIKIVRD